MRRTIQPSALGASIIALAFAMAACSASGATPATSVVATPAAVATTVTATAAQTIASSGLPKERVAYGRFGSSGVTMFTARTDGTDERMLRPPDAESAKWSPDGHHISIVSQNAQGLIFYGLMNPDGSGYTPLRSPDPTLNLGCVAWSPDSLRLACEGWDDSNPARTGIYTVRALDGGGLTRVTTAPAGTYDFPGDYSPDGKMIVFVTGGPDESTGPLMVINVDGTGRHALNGQEGAGAGDWSPDGKTILTVAPGSLLVLVPAVGGPSVPITFEVGTADATEPAWSPDGDWIICTRLVSTGLDIFIVRKDGTDLHQITRTNGMAEEFGTWEILPH